MDKTQLKETILKRIERPEIPARIYSALEFGIVPDCGTIQTVQLQRAINQISEEGGGTLVLPAGRYRTGALRLKSRVELHLESRKTLLSFVSEDPEIHYPLVFSHWEATPCYNFSPLIYACDETDIAVTGEGTLDGGADREHWWNWHHQVENAWSEDKPDLQLEDRKALRRMNMDGIPVKERVFGPGHYLRPNFIQPIRCRRVLLQGFTLKNSPMWQLNPVMCRSLTVDGVIMSSHGANNDGCDPESCSGVHICNCRFDTGDDCISLKSGRDRDGRMANVPCQYVLIENNEFADGHGGIALGSEMSGGIRCVLAVNNRFSSPNLTYALRLKTNARRGGKVEDIILADSVMDHVHGAAVHGTMLYEDGRNGNDLPVFRNITIENIKAHGGDYGIFLEAFEEVPITGLVLKQIEIDGVSQMMRSMNWKDPVIRQVTINGKQFPRPCRVRILGIPAPGSQVEGAAEYCGGQGYCRFRWETTPADGMCRPGGRMVSDPEAAWRDGGEGRAFVVPDDAGYVRVTAIDEQGNEETSAVYQVLTGTGAGCCEGQKDPEAQNEQEEREEQRDRKKLKGREEQKQYERMRLACRGMLEPVWKPVPGTRMTGDLLNGTVPPVLHSASDDDAWITREQLAAMLLPLADPALECRNDKDGHITDPGAADKNDKSEEAVSEAMEIAVENGFLALDEGKRFLPEGYVTRQEMATVAMQACGVNYRNASSTMPVCTDASKVSNNYGTNVARALYFGFMELEPDGCFLPGAFITVGEAVSILNRVADFAGI